MMTARRSKRGVWRLATAGLLAAAVLGCALLRRTAVDAHTVLIAKRIESKAELCQGPEAKGEVGHFLLMNAEIKAVISSADYAYAFSSSGGNILDLARTADNYDEFTHFYMLMNTYWPNQAHYTKVEVLRDGRDGEKAVIRATGHDLENPRIQVVTDYQLGPHDRYLTIRSVVTNEGDSEVTKYAVGDAVQWGTTDNFAPGVGYELLNVNKTFPWVATQGERVSYGYALDTDEFDSMNHSTWTDSYVRNLTLRPHEPFVFTRYLSVGTGSVASAAEVLLGIKKIKLGTVEGYIREVGTEKPVGNATVTLSTKEYAPFVTTVSDEAGHYAARVPAGSYEVLASKAGHASGKAKQIQVQAGLTATSDFGVGARGMVRYEVREEHTGKLLPAKIVVESLEGPNPYLGSPERADGALNNVLSATGQGEFALPPGRYRIAGTHGLAYSVEWKEVDVKASAATAIRLELKREVTAPGWFTADFHVHANPSDDSAVTLRDRVVSLAAEGIQIAAATDHNVIADYWPTIHRMGLDAELFAMPGDELTTVKWGHFNVYPLRYEPEKRWGGAMEVRDQTPESLFSKAREMDEGRDKVVQVNHPRWPYQKHAYFDNVQLDVHKLEESKARGFSLNFDALEIMNGLWNGEKYFATELILKDWFALLNKGYVFTAVGDSDSHAVATQEVGYPRNYIFLGEAASLRGMNLPEGRRAAEDAVVRAIKSHRVTVSNGPMVTLSVGEHGRIGDTVSVPASAGPVKLRVKVQWPEWMGAMDTLQVIANGEEVKRIPLAGLPSPAEITVELTPATDAWVVVEVRGSRPMDPVLPTWKGRANTPFAVTNPIWIDRDGNGKFEAPAGKP